MCVGVPVVVLRWHLTTSVTNLAIYFGSFSRPQDPQQCGIFEIKQVWIA